MDPQGSLAGPSAVSAVCYTVSMDLCHDCDAAPGEAHEDMCDVARCLHCGEQRLMHALTGEGCGWKRWGQDVWTGEWPGSAECREFGWFVRWGPPWIPTTADDPEAMPDLNRLVSEAKWSRSEHRWVLA